MARHAQSVDDALSQTGFYPAFRWSAPAIQQEVWVPTIVLCRPRDESVARGTKDLYVLWLPAKPLTKVGDWPVAYQIPDLHLVDSSIEDLKGKLLSIYGKLTVVDYTDGNTQDFTKMAKGKSKKGRRNPITVRPTYEYPTVDALPYGHPYFAHRNPWSDIPRVTLCYIDACNQPSQVSCAKCHRPVCPDHVDRYPGQYGQPYCPSCLQVKQKLGRGNPGGTDWKQKGYNDGLTGVWDPPNMQSMDVGPDDSINYWRGSAQAYREKAGLKRQRKKEQSALRWARWHERQGNGRSNPRKKPKQFVVDLRPFAPKPQPPPSARLPIDQRTLPDPPQRGEGVLITTVNSFERVRLPTDPSEFLQFAYRILNVGTIDIVYRTQVPGTYLIVDDEGLLMGSPTNQVASLLAGGSIVGDVLWVRSEDIQ